MNCSIKKNRIFPYTLLSIILILPAAVAAMSAGSTVNLIKSDNTGIELEVEIVDLNISPEPKSNQEQYRITITGESNAGASGLPDLPHISRMLVVHPTAAIDLSWESSDPRIIPARTPVTIPQSDFSGDQILNSVEDGIQLREFYPEQIVEISEPAIMRGTRLIRVTVNPVQFDIKSNDLRVYDHIRIRLDYTVNNALNPVKDPHRARPSITAHRMLRSLVMNPQDITRDSDGERGSFIYVIPEFEGVAETIAPLVNWRCRQGYPTEVIAIGRRDNNVDVRNAIREAYEEWDVPPEQVTLIGDADLDHADFMIPTWDVGRVYMWETDYKFALLEGNDLLPEVAVSRISARSIAELRRVVQKILQYESDPFMDETEWYIRAAVMANDFQTGYSSIYLQRWLRKMLLEVGFAEVDTFYFIHENQVSDHEFIRDNVNEGISLFNYRGWGQFSGAWRVGQANEFRNGRKLTLFVLPTCNTCDFADHILSPHSYAEDFLWANNGGAIGTIGSSGFTHTNYNNVLDGGILNAFYRDDVWQIGWALNQGKLELFRHFGLFNDVEDPQVEGLLCWEAHAYQYNLIGDGGTELWTGIPQQVNVQHPDVITTGENLISVIIQDSENDEPVPDATVTLVKDNEIMRVGKTDTEGFVRFTFTPGELEPGEIQLTATRHNMVPHLADIEVEVPQVFLGFSSLIIDDDRAGRSRGNGDHLASPDEILELRTYVANYGNAAPQNPVELDLILLNGDVRIIQGEANIEQPPARGDSAMVTFVVELGQAIYNGQRIIFQLDVAEGENIWQSAIDFGAATSDLEYIRHVFNPDPFNTGDTAWVDVTLRNIGAIPSQAMEATLISGREAINVYNDRADVTPVYPEGNDSLAVARFRIHAHDLTVPGTRADMTILFASEDGFLDTTHFAFVVGEAGDGTPFGPDAYGYVCFDDTDGDWEGVPEYNWIEIAPDLGGQGTDTEIHDQGNELDFSVTVDLPFNFSYYGQDFELITICSNGWFAFGDESKLADFQNRRIPPALGPRAQVCVFWDDLVNDTLNNGDQVGGIFHWYDDQNHRFIIEWSRMRRYIGLDEHGNMRPGGENTFQAILLDPQIYQTPTGDGEIIFQYETVNNDAAVDPNEFDTPYSTVGIVNLNGTDGIEYTYWNEYSNGAAPLQDNRAIKFSTRLIAKLGYVQGIVLDAENGNPIIGAEIRGNRGSFGLTRENGRFFMEALVADDYAFTAWAPGFNDSTISGFDVEEGDTISLSFSLLHPEFALSRDRLEVGVRPGYGAEEGIRLSNSGNGTLEFRSYFDYLGEEEDQRWQRLLHFNATERTGDDKINGVDLFDDCIWISGSNGRENPNLFYKFNRHGQFANIVEQPGNSNWGFRGTTTDGELLYGGDRDWILGVNEEGAIEDSIRGPLDAQRSIAYDRNDHFWVANGNLDPLVKIDREGEIVFSWQHELDIQGLGYLPDDPEGYTVYILSRDKTDPALQVPKALVSKFNPITEHLKSVTVINADIEDQAGGMEIVSNFDPTKWIMMAVLNHPLGDKVSVYDMGPNTTWVQYEPRAASIEAGSSRLLHFTLSSENLTEGEYGILLRFIHNAAGLETDFPITLRVGENESVGEKSSIPLVFNLQQNYPNPFNATTGIPFSLPEAGAVKLTIYNAAGRELAMLVDDELKAGYHSVGFDAVDYPSGVYMAKLNFNRKTDRIKMVLIK